MSKIRLLMFLALALGIILVAGCSTGTSVTDPGIGRNLEGGGGGCPPGGGPGGGGPGPGPEFDCVRGFAVNYTITPPMGDVIGASGGVKIFDYDCATTDSDVIVKFKVMDPQHPMMNFMHVIPGTKTTTAEGLLYKGSIHKEQTMMHHSFVLDISFELLVSLRDDIDVPVIEGWVDKTMAHGWESPNGEQHQWEHNWHADIEGAEVIPGG